MAALPDQSEHEIAADETGAAGDQNRLHLLRKPRMLRGAGARAPRQVA
jgi:hypothetical protein